MPPGEAARISPAIVFSAVVFLISSGSGSHVHLLKPGSLVRFVSLRQRTQPQQRTVLSCVLGCGGVVGAGITTLFQRQTHPQPSQQQQYVVRFVFWSVVGV